MYIFLHRSSFYSVTVVAQNVVVCQSFFPGINSPSGTVQL